MTKKIAVYAIAKNELQFVERFVESCKDADVILIADTGSTDGTLEKLEELKTTYPNLMVTNICISPWRFDSARNAALAAVPRDVDICITLDLDEVLVEGWRQQLLDSWTETTTRLSYWYTWSWKEGKPDVAFWGDRTHSRHGYTWKFPCHETLYWVGSTPTEVTSRTEMRIEHYADDTKPRSQYLPLLTLSYEENPNHPRPAFYLGREYFFYKQYKDAIKQFLKYLEIPNDWTSEQASALTYISKCWHALGDIDRARIAALQAVTTESNKTTLGWCAELSYSIDDWSGVSHYSDRALTSPVTNTYIDDPKYTLAYFQDIRSIAWFQMGQFTSSLTCIEAALAADPTNARLIANYDLINSKYRPSNKEDE